MSVEGGKSSWVCGGLMRYKSCQYHILRVIFLIYLNVVKKADKILLLSHLFELISSCMSCIALGTYVSGMILIKSMPMLTKIFPIASKGLKLLSVSTGLYKVNSPYDNI